MELDYDFSKVLRQESARQSTSLDVLMAILTIIYIRMASHQYRAGTLSTLSIVLLFVMLLTGCSSKDSNYDSSGYMSSSVSSSISSSSSSSSSTSSVSADLPPPLSSTSISLDDRHQVGDLHWPDGDSADGGQGQPVGELKCNVTSQAYHVHSHLSIYLNGQALAVPAHIGIVQTSATSHCNYSTHTHDTSGIVHVEAPAPGVFTLGQFFAIWGQSLSYSDIAGNPGMPVVVYVTDNAVVTQYTGDLAAIELLSHREITIQIGTPITEIPNYTWTEA